jgi:uncharacterized membrane protein YhaH (DUF805 family)
MSDWTLWLQGAGMAVLDSLGHNLRRLVDFRGRDTRGQFWPWAAILYLLSLIAATVVFAPVMADWMARIQRYIIEHPKGPPVADPYKTGANIFPTEMMPDFSRMYVPMMIIKAVWILLMAASVTRRLHDRDRSGLWALAYVASAAIAAWFGPTVFASMSSGNLPGALLPLLTINNLLGFLVMVLLIIQFANRGTAGPNRFGPDPLNLG